MARFLKHVSCDRCGSSDARAIYDDGSSFCFSCRKPTPSKVSPYVEMYRRNVLEESKMESFQEKAVRLPPDATTNYSEGAVAWASKYEITIPQLLKEGVVYSPSKEQLIFTWHNDLNKLIAYQARNLNPVSKGKRYFTCGDVNELLPIYPCRFNLPGTINSRRLVLVEDCLSAIKVAAVGCDASCEALGADAMPLLGNSISKEKLVRLRHLYDILYVFLDGDMYPNAMKISGQAQLLGFSTKVIYSEKDPKEHDKKSLTSLLT